MTAIKPSGGITIPIRNQMKNELPLPRPMTPVPRPKKKAMTRYCTFLLWRAWSLDQRLRLADRADLGDVAAERQAGGPVEDGAELAGGARDLAHVVGPGHPPGGEAAEGAVADPADGLVAAEVDEARFAAVVEGLGGADPELGGDVARGDRPLADGVLRGRRAGAAAGVGSGGAVADRPDRVHALHPQVGVDRHATALVERQVELGEDRLRLDPGGP